MTIEKRLAPEGERALRDPTTMWSSRVSLAHAQVAEDNGCEVWEVSDDHAIALLQDIDGDDGSPDDYVARMAPPYFCDGKYVEDTSWRTPSAGLTGATESRGDRTAMPRITHRATAGRAYTADERREIAVHEASHAVLAAALGIRFESAHCYSSDGECDGYSGRMIHSGYAGYPPADAIAVLAAPGFAVRNILGREQARDAHTLDSKQINEIADRCGRRRDDAKSIGFRDAQILVNRHHNQIKALAGILESRGSATEKEVWALFPRN